MINVPDNSCGAPGVKSVQYLTQANPDSHPFLYRSAVQAIEQRNYDRVSDDIKEALMMHLPIYKWTE